MALSLSCESNTSHVGEAGASDLLCLHSGKELLLYHEMYEDTITFIRRAIIYRIPL